MPRSRRGKLIGWLNASPSLKRNQGQCALTIGLGLQTNLALVPINNFLDDDQPQAMATGLGTRRTVVGGEQMR